jgi:hypothetical protein
MHLKQAFNDFFHQDWQLLPPLFSLSLSFTCTRARAHTHTAAVAALLSSVWHFAPCDRTGLWHQHSIWEATVAYDLCLPPTPTAQWTFRAWLMCGDISQVQVTIIINTGKLLLLHIPKSHVDCTFFFPKTISLGTLRQDWEFWKTCIGRRN